VANGAGLKTAAWLTDMNQVLGTSAGNALEVREAIDYLTGARREARLHAVTLTLSAELLVLGGLARDHDAARARVEAVLASGAAAELFARMVAALGGPVDLMTAPARHLPVAPVTLNVTAAHAGYVVRQDVRAIGVAVMGLGGGRRRADDRIDPAVGFSDICALGDEMAPDRVLAVVHARDRAGAETAAAAIRAAVEIGAQRPAQQMPARERIGGP
jgi:thymidine phosphorylase